MALSGLMGVILLTSPAVSPIITWQVHEWMKPTTVELTVYFLHQYNIMRIVCIVGMYYFGIYDCTALK
jgi:hypothetical protein